MKWARARCIVTAHFGLFELGGLLLAQHGFPAVVLTYPEPSRALTDWRGRSAGCTGFGRRAPVHLYSCFLRGLPDYARGDLGSGPRLGVCVRLEEAEEQGGGG